jgi:hypothetical protein
MIEKIVEELHKQDLVKKLLRKKSVWDCQTIYGDLNDYMRDMYDLSPHDREIVVERLLGKYVIRNIYDVVL